MFTLTDGCLRLTGRESLGSWGEQTLVARRQEESAYRAAAVFRADPPGWQQAVGLTTDDNRHTFHAALITREAGQRVITLVSCLGDWLHAALTFHGASPCPMGDVTLGVQVTGARQQFTLNGAALGPVLDASLISDEAGKGAHASFTGAFVGVVAYDLTGQGWQADVLRFDYDDRDLITS